MSYSHIHRHSHIRRRTLLAYRALSEQGTHILKKILPKMRKRLNDEDLSVVHATLTVSIVLMNAQLMSSEHFHPILTKLFRRTWNERANQIARALLPKVMQAIEVTTPSVEDFEIMRDIVSSRSSVASIKALEYQCFLLAAANPEAVQAPIASAFIKGIRHLLVSEDPNDVYVFIHSLNLLDPKLWAGSVEVPAVLEGWEVERVMTLLNSEDELVRSQTIQVLLRVDRSIVEAYYQRLTSSIHDAEDLRRCLQIAGALSGEDGESYAQHLVHQLRAIGDEPSQRHILQDAVELSLTHIRGGHSDFRSGCIGVLFTILVEPEEQMGPTLFTITTALVCEYLDNSPISPENILGGLTRLLPLYPADIQEACLLAMIRVSAKCESISDATQIVRKVQESAGRHIKRRCDQFINLAGDKPFLSQLVASSGLTLPGILLALENLSIHDRPQSSSRSPIMGHGGSQDGSRPSSRASTSGYKLRYAAYDAPRPTPRLRRLSSSSSRSADTSSHDPDELLSKTVTAGDLALASGRRDLQELARSPVLSSTSPPPVHATPVSESENPSQVDGDLLGLDSPFLTEPPTATLASSISSLNNEPDFEQMWTTLAHANYRGWCEFTIDVVVRKLQGLHHAMRVIASDQPPFRGELKIILTPSLGSENRGIAILRLKESEDDSCLWQMRCADDGLRTNIRELLTDIEE